MSSKTDKRAKEILRLLLRHGKTSVEDLTAELTASPASIRRDLTRLEEQGLVYRTHGGAMLTGKAVYEPFRFDASFHVREDRFATEKLRIAHAAAALVKEHETIGLAAGTTTTLIARQLLHRRGIHIITNAINIGMELCNQPGIRTYLTGGVVPWAWSFSLTGNAALTFLDNVIMDKVFLSVTGLDAERGATTLETDEALVYRKMLKQSKQVIVVADASKLGKVSPAFICQLTEMNILITDTSASPELLAPFERQGIRIIRA